MSETTLDEWGNGGGSKSAESCLSFTVRGPWAHFRRVEGNIVKQTYRIIPRTTVAGLVAAVMGIGRDEYYDLFGPDVSKVAIEPTEPLRTINLPMNTLSTANENITMTPKRGKNRVGLPDPSAPRQQHNYEVLVDPAYRIDLWLDDDDRYRELRSHLEAGTAHYVPSLGLSEHLAAIEYHGEFEVEDGPEETASVDSAIPGPGDAIVPDPDVRWGMEKSPAFMTADEGGRTTRAFTSYTYNPAAEPLTVTDVSTSIVDGRTVIFT